MIHEKNRKISRRHTHTVVVDDKREDLFIVLIIMTQGKTPACPLREPIDAHSSIEKEKVFWNFS